MYICHMSSLVYVSESYLQGGLRRGGLISAAVPRCGQIFRSIRYVCIGATDVR